MVSRLQYERVLAKEKTIEEETARLGKTFKTVEAKGTSLAQLICRPDWSYERALQSYPDQVADFGEEINTQIELQLKYFGYIERQKKDVAKLERLDGVRIPRDFEYGRVVGLRAEAVQKFSRFTPENLGQASRISGMTPSDISILLIALENR